MKENWKNIKGYEGLYQVSDHGRVRSLDRVVSYRTGGRRNWKGKVRKLSVSTAGYLCVNLYKNGTPKPYSVHRLVALTFLGPCPKGLEVRHGVGGILDNTPKNLQYGTRSENYKDRIRDGTCNSKPVRRSDGAEYASATEAAKVCGLKQSSSISGVCRKYIKPNGDKCLTAAGYTWDYI